MGGEAVSEFSIRDKCRVNTNREADTFVGLICDDGDISIHFPLGFHVSNDEKDLRRDIMLLLSTIGNTIGHKESTYNRLSQNSISVGFPIQAYLSVIYDFMERGYYIEREVEYISSKKGKINWARTIKNVKPVIQDEEVFYLDFITRRNKINEDNLITLIHEYCVYESFLKIGWLFTGALPQFPRIKRNDKLFLSVLKEKMAHTYNDKNKNLFKNMILIVKNLSDENAPMNYKYGTYRFEDGWEAMIDRVYGIEGKDVYFPKTTWKVGGRSYNNASLEPDSIMIRGNNIYVLDAKYYKYGATKWLGDLPESTSINKQITYGEFVAMNKAEGNPVYNAFIMPFDSEDENWKSGPILSIGEATGDWRLNDKLYERIQGILVDVKYLMQITVREDVTEINKLADCIETAVRGNNESNNI